jgi:hypothetical protein
MPPAITTPAEPSCWQRATEIVPPSGAGVRRLLPLRHHIERCRGCKVAARLLNITTINAYKQCSAGFPTHIRCASDRSMVLSVAPRVLRPFGSARLSWHTAAMACPYKSCPFAGRLRSTTSILARGRT